MKRTVIVDGHEHTLEISGSGKLSCRFDSSAFEADAAEVAPDVYSLLIADESFEARVSTNDGNTYSVEVDGIVYQVSIDDPRSWSRGKKDVAVAGTRRITAPMSGKIVRVLVAEGQQVAAGEGLVVVEAMKMQNEIKSPKAGVVSKVAVQTGQAVNSGDALLVVE